MSLCFSAHVFSFQNSASSQAPRGPQPQTLQQLLLYSRWPPGSHATLDCHVFTEGAGGRQAHREVRNPQCPSCDQPSILLVLFKALSLSSGSCGRKCPTGGLSSEEQMNPHPTWGWFPAKQGKLPGAFKGFGRSPGIVVFVILSPFRERIM